MKVRRQYQSDALEAVKYFWERNTSGIIHLFTGAGKTFLAGELLKEVIDLKTQRAVFIAPALHLVHQTYIEFLAEYSYLSGDIEVGKVNKKLFPKSGIMQANHNDYDARLIIACMATLLDQKPSDFERIMPSDVISDDSGAIYLAPSSNRSVLVSERFDAVLRNGGMPDLFIYDECHHSVSDGGLVFFSRIWEICDILGIKRSKLIGMTATPFRDDSIGLNNLYETMIFSRTFLWGQQHGYLTPLQKPIRVYSETNKGKVSSIELGDMNERIFEAYEEHAKGKPFFAIPPSVEASKSLAEYFTRNGVPTAHLDGKESIDPKKNTSSPEDRHRLFEEGKNGKITGFASWGVLVEGVDCPWISTLLWARPTENSLVLTQAIGRILRLFQGNDAWEAKKFCLLIDFTGKPLVVTPTGTLLGIQRQPFDLEDIEEKQEQDADELLLSAGIDLRDLSKQGQIIGRDNVYVVSQLISQQIGDFFHDEISNIMSLAVSPNDTLVILPPAWTAYNRVKDFTSKVPQNEKNLDLLVKLAQAEELFSTFTLWHIHSNGFKTTIKNNTWVSTEEGLDQLISDAVSYAYDEIEGAANVFIKKRAKWKSQPMTQKQSGLLKSLCRRYNYPFDEHMTSGDAAKLITYLKVKPLVVNSVQNLLQDIDKRIKNV